MPGSGMGGVGAGENDVRPKTRGVDHEESRLREKLPPGTLWQAAACARELDGPPHRYTIASCTQAPAV